MNKRFFVVTLLAAVLLTAACSCPSGNRPQAAGPAALETSAKASTVQTASGPVAGYIDDGVFIFKGIPYAKAARFMPAEDPDPWTEVRPSRAYGPTCPQDKRSGWWSDDQAFAMHWDDGFPDEDCLRLNIWTGGLRNGVKRPVMVWLHGGGFRAGSGQELISYDGTNLARDHGVVVVSLNHRLNVLGFLDLSAYGAKEVAVRVEQYVVLPAVVAHEGLHLVDVLRLIDAHGKNLDAGLFLPVSIDLADGIELAVAGLAPRGEKVDDEGLAVIRKGIRTHLHAAHRLQRDGRQLSLHLMQGKGKCHSKKKQ